MSPPARLSLLARIYLANVAVIAVAVLLLAFTPITITAPVIRAAEAALVLAGAALVLGLDLLLVRRTLEPLRRLERDLADGRTLDPPPRLASRPGDAAEVVALADAFNALVDRLLEERRAHARGALRAQEEERLRIARELHDEIGQTLTAVALHAERMAAGPAETLPGALREIAAGVRSSLDDVRRVASELRPEALDDLGLTNALISLATQLSLRSGVPVVRELDDAPPALPDEVELALYRVAQEALTNAIRHAAPSEIVLSLSAEDGEVVLRVTDDGAGLPDGGPAAAGNGLAGMRERALLVGGRLTLRPAPGRGTELTLRLAVP